MSDSQFAAFLFLQLAILLAVCRGVGLLAKRAGQPQVVAEMVAGFLAGPSFFGWLAARLTGAPSQDALILLSIGRQQGLITPTLAVKPA